MKHLLPTTTIGLIFITCIIVLQIVASQSGYLFERNFWLDEVHTYYVTDHSDLKKSMQTLKGGVNGSPPTYFLALRAFNIVCPGSIETAYRLFSFISLLLGLGGLYCLLRRFYTPMVCLTAILATWSTPLVIRNAFEARHYAFWFAVAVWFAISLDKTINEKSHWTWKLITAVLAFFTCTIHYFGIISLCAIAAATSLPHLPMIFKNWTKWLWVLPGPLGLALFLPMLKSQQNALDAPTWVDPVSIKDMMSYVSEFFPATHLPLLVVASWISVLIGKNFAMKNNTQSYHSLLGATGLLLLPIILLAFSLILQPVMIPRYALPTMAAVGILYAHLLSRSPQKVVYPCFLYFFLMGTVCLKLFADSAKTKDLDLDNFIEALESRELPTPIVFEITKYLDIICFYEPSLINDCVLLDVPDEDIIRGVDDFRIHVVHVAKNVERHLGAPSTSSWKELSTHAHLYLIPGHRYQNNLAGIEKDYPGYIATKVRDNLILLKKIDIQSGTIENT